MAAGLPAWLKDKGSIGQMALDSEVTPMYSISTILETLQTEAGFPKQVVDQLQGTAFPLYSSGGEQAYLAIDTVPDNLEEFIQKMENQAILQTDLTLAVGMLGSNIQKLLSSVTATERQATAHEVAEIFVEEANASAEQLNLECFFVPKEDGVYDHDGDIFDVFTDGLQFIPSRSTVVGESTEAWPYYTTKCPLDLGTENVPVELEDLAPLFSRRTALAYRLLPSTGRLVALKMATTMAGRKSISMVKYLERLHAKDTNPMRVKSIVEVAALHRARPRPDQVDDGKESNVQRIIRRSAYYSALLANTLLALQKAYNQALTVETISVRPQEQKTPHFQPEEFVSYQRLAKKTIYRMMDNAHHPLTGGWVYSEVGCAMRPSKSKGTESSNNTAGITFLQNQLKIKDTVYRMPDIKAPQVHWEDWFQRIEALPVMYKGINASLVIPALITNIRADDARIYGWQESIVIADQKGKELGLSDFLAHVRKLVIPTGVARKQAAQELRQLTDKPSSVDDCQALGSKIQKVFRHLFPKVTEESEPISRLTAMKLVHQLMDNLKSAKGNKGATILAWKQYSGYFHSQMFLEFLEESLHISQAKSEDLCQRYLEQIVHHLETAHKMYVQTRDVTETNSNTSHQVNAFGNNKGGKGSNPPQKGKRKDQQSNVFADTKKRKTANRAAATGGSQAGSDGPQRQTDSAQHMAKIIAGLKNANAAFTDRKLKVGQFRHTVSNGTLPVLTMDQCQRDIFHGACAVCQQKGHRAGKCTLWGSADQDGKSNIIKYKKAFNEAYYGTDQ